MDESSIKWSWNYLKIVMRTNIQFVDEYTSSQFFGAHNSPPNVRVKAYLPPALYSRIFFWNLR